VSFLAYTRVSTHEQGESGLSLEAQERTLRDEAARRGWDVELVSEVASTRRRDRRFETVLDNLDAGLHEGLMVTALDRMVRSNYEFARLLERSQRRGWELVMLWPNVDTTDPYGKAFAQTASIWAELERNLISRRTREAMAAKKAQGPYGRPQIPEPLRTRIRALHAGGDGYADICRTLEAEGVPTPRGGARWYRSTVRNAVRV
jgi:DNA invertase Pin-like site-specific DNA recombinase